MNAKKHSEIALVIGTRFVDEASRLAQDDPARWVGDYDRDVLRSPIDLLVDRQNLTGDLPDEPVLPFCRGLVAVTESLAKGRRVTLELIEAPVELVFEPWSQETIALTLVEFGRVPDFRTHRSEVRSIEFLEAIRGAILRAKGAAQRASDALAEELAGFAANLVPGPYPTALPKPTLGLVTVETRSESGQTICTVVAPDSTGLGDQDAFGQLGRFVLMATGSVTISGVDGRGVSLDGAPLMTLDSLVDALVPEARRRTEAAQVELLRTKAGVLRAGFRDGRTLLEHPSGKPLPLGTDELLRLVSDHATAVVDALKSANPSLNAHGGLRELYKTAAALRIRLPRALSASGPQEVVRAVQRPRIVPRNAAGWAFPSSAIRRMRYERGWTLVREGLLPRTVAHRNGGGLLFCHENAVELIDVRTGETRAEVPLSSGVRVREDNEELVLFADTGVAWLSATTLAKSREERWPASKGRVRAVAVERGAAFAALDNGRLMATNGRGIGWSAITEGSPPTGLAATDDILVVARPGIVEGRSRDDGQLLWFANVRLERVSVRIIANVVAVVADDPLKHATLLGTLEATTGRWIRRNRFAADVRAVGWKQDRGVALLLDDGQQIRAAALDVAAGVDWSAPTRFALAQNTPKVRLDPEGIVATCGRSVARIGPDGVAWQSQPEATRTGEIRMARRNLSDGLIVVAGDSELLVIETSEGRVLHRVPAFWEQLQTLLADAQGHIVVVETPDEGKTRIHGVSAVGVIAALEGGRSAANE